MPAITQGDNMTVARHKVKMSLADLERHPYRYVTREGQPAVLTMDEDTGASVLVLVELVAVDDLSGALVA
jgi:hypothetical protein